METKFTDSEWFYWVRLSVKVAVVVGVVYVAYHFYERSRIANMGREPEVKRIELPKDVFAFVPKSNVTDLAARAPQARGQASVGQGGLPLELRARRPAVRPDRADRPYVRGGAGHARR